MKHKSVKTSKSHHQAVNADDLDNSTLYLQVCHDNSDCNHWNDHTPVQLDIIRKIYKHTITLSANIIYIIQFTIVLGTSGNV